MKNLLKTLFVLVALTLIGCDKGDNTTRNTLLDVTPNNIAGEWQLESWCGTALAEGSYVYIEFTRADRTFCIYQNIDSAEPRLRTGRYNITIDAEFGAIIRGQYDYGAGDWAHRYIVDELTADRMIWTAKDDPSDVSIYVRTTIPANIKKSNE